MVIYKEIIIIFNIMSISTWNIKYNEEDIENVMYKITDDSKTYLLNTLKTDFNILERFVFDIASFHLNRLSITKDYYIEFWSRKKTLSPFMHIDCDISKAENDDYQYPICFSLTYLNDNNSPTFITDIDIEQYKYKDFPTENNFIFSFPKKMKHITFNGNKFHGIANLFENDEPRYIIAINIWNQKPLNVPYYSEDIVCYIEYPLKPNKVESKMEFIETTNYKNIETDCDILNDDFFEKIFYEKQTSPFLNISNLFDISSINLYDAFIVTTYKTPLMLEYNELFNKYGSIISELKLIHNQKHTSNTRFNKYQMVKHLFCKDISNWIMDESKQYFVNSTSILKMNPSVIFYNLVMISINNTIKENILNLYNIPFNIKLLDFYIFKFDSKDNVFNYNQIQKLLTTSKIFSFIPLNNNINETIIKGDMYIDYSMNHFPKLNNVYILLLFFDLEYSK